MSLASPCFGISGDQPKDLGRFQALPLDDKIHYTNAKIRQFYIAMKGKVYVAFSGGKDSTVLLHLVRSIYPEVPAVYCDTIQNIVGGRKEVVLMDNNLLAYGGAVDAMEWMIEKKVRADINQGLDWRLVNAENLDAMRRLRHVPPYTFAFDDLRYMDGVTEAVSRIREHISRPYETRWYCYIHPDSFGGLDGLVKRVEWCRDHEALPYVMRDAACWNMREKEKAFLWDFTAWCNQPGMWKRMTFKEFIDARHPHGGNVPDMAKAVYENLTEAIERWRSICRLRSSGCCYMASGRRRPCAGSRRPTLTARY